MADSEFLVSDEGITCLHTGGAKPIADIVFVHGLGGHPQKTWSAEPSESATSGDSSFRIRSAMSKTIPKFLGSKGHDMSPEAASVPNKVFWPYHLLPADTADVRILTYGYYSSPAGPSQDNLYSLSKNMLMRVARERIGAPRRPLVFVAHSLGGILTKFALKLSQDCTSGADAWMKAVRDSVVGVIFFATPHSGSDLASWGELLRRTASVFVVTNPKLLAALNSQADNGQLEELRKSFVKMLGPRSEGKFRVVSFRETKPLANGPLGPLARLVVPLASSDIVSEWATDQTVATDHRDICRFGGADDPKYKAFIQELKGFLGEILLENEGRKPPQILLTAEVRAFLRSQGSPHNRSCDWILAHPKFEDWTRRQDAHTLHIVGEPGCGKSTAAAWLFQNCARWCPESRRCAVFSFQSGRKDNDPSSAWISFIEQLIGEDVSNFGRSQDWSRKEAQFPAELKDVSAVYVIDGIDECDQKTTWGFLESLSRLIQSSETPKPKILLFSRHNMLSQIDRSFKHSVVHRIDMNSEDQQIRNVEEYIRNKVEALCDLRPGLSEFQENIIDNLDKRSSGIYLLPALTLESLAKSKGSPAEIRNILGDLPQNLQAIYSDALRKVSYEDRERVSAMLLWLMFAMRPLQESEISAAIEFSCRKRNFMSLNEFDDEVSRDILGTSGISELVGPLIKRTADGFVSMVHSSAREYMLSLGNAHGGRNSWVWEGLLSDGSEGRGDTPLEGSDRHTYGPGCSPPRRRSRSSDRFERRERGDPDRWRRRDRSRSREARARDRSPRRRNSSSRRRSPLRRSPTQIFSSWRDDRQDDRRYGRHERPRSSGIFGARSIGENRPLREQESRPPREQESRSPREQEDLSTLGARALSSHCLDLAELIEDKVFLRSVSKMVSDSPSHPEWSQNLHSGVISLLKYSVENLPDHLRRCSSPVAQSNDQRATPAFSRLARDESRHSLPRTSDLAPWDRFTRFLQQRPQGDRWMRTFWVLRDPTQYYEHKFTPLHFCCALGLVECVRRLLTTSRFRPNLEDETNREYLAAVDVASMFGNVDILEVLCGEHEVPVDLRLLTRISHPVITASSSPSGSVRRPTLGDMIRPDAPGGSHTSEDRSSSDFHGGIDELSESEGILSWLVSGRRQRGDGEASTDTTTELRHYQPLFTATRYGQVAAINYLVKRSRDLFLEDENDKGDNPDQTGATRRIALEVAIDGKNHAAASALYRHHTKGWINTRRLLERFILAQSRASEQNLHRLAYLVEHNPELWTPSLSADPSISDDWKMSILHACASVDDVVLFGFLVHHWRRLNPCPDRLPLDSQRRHPLHYAAAACTTEIIECIVQADPDSLLSVDTQNKNCLYYAMSGIDLPWVSRSRDKALLEQVLQVLVGHLNTGEARDALVGSAIASLAEDISPSTESMEQNIMILLSLATPSLRIGGAFLYRAVASHNFPLQLAVGISAQEALDFVDMDGRNVLHTAVAATKARKGEQGFSKLVEALKGKINEQNNRGKTPLHDILDGTMLMQRSEHRSRVMLLLEFGGSVDGPDDKYGLSPFLVAAQLIIRYSSDRIASRSTPGLIGFLLSRAITKDSAAKAVEAIPNEVLRELIVALGRIWSANYVQDAHSRDFERDIKYLTAYLTDDQHYYLLRCALQDEGGSAKLVIFCHKLWQLQDLEQVVNTFGTVNLDDLRDLIEKRKDRDDGLGELESLCRARLETISN